MKKRIRYFIVLLLVLSVILEGTGYREKRADATIVGEYEVISDVGGHTEKDRQYWYDGEFSLDGDSMKISFWVNSLVGLTYNVKNCDTGRILAADTISADSDQWEKLGKGFRYSVHVGETKFTADGKHNYRIIYTFDGETEYKLSATDEWNSGIVVRERKLNKAKLTLTKGFQYKLKAENCFSKGEWYSTDPFVATVDQKGLVTAWRPGKAEIYYEDIYGNKPYCRVTVKENAYTKKKPKVASVKKGTSLLKVYQVEQVDDNGTLEVKAVLVNRTDHKAVKFQNFQIQIKNKKGKTIVNYKKKGIKLNVASGRTKELTFVIPKSKLKIKEVQDLRQSSIKVNKKVTFA